jgi:hypothetical protein
VIQQEVFCAEEDYAPFLSASRLDLQLHAVGVKRFRQAEGRLPETLAQGTYRAATRQDWFSWAKNKAETSHADGEMLDLHGETLATRTPFPLDMLGLPVIYRCGADNAGDAGWVRSTDPLDSRIDAYLREQGVLPTPASEPFALTTTAYQDATAKIQTGKARITLYRSVRNVGFIALIATTLIAVFFWKGPQPVRRDVIYPMWALSILILAVLLAPAVPAYSSIRSGPRWKTLNYYNKSRRLQFLDKAIQLRAVDPETARLSRDYIDNLPDDRCYFK